MEDKTLKALHGALLEILIEVDRLCRANDINYFLDSGTALGAIRHAGFIPWDDDIDIGMTRENYDKFIAIASQQLDGRFFLQTVETDPYYNKLHAKVRKNGTIFIEKDNGERKMHEGVFIDVFPFDYIPLKWSKFILWMNESYQRIFRWTAREDHQASLKKWFCYTIVGKHPQRRYDKLCKLFSNKNDEGMISYNYFFNEHYIFPSSIFQYTIEANFEGRKFMMMKDYDAYLKIMYGDYMKLPPEEKRVTHDVYKLEL